MKELVRKIIKGDVILWATVSTLLVISGVIMFSAISTSTYRYEDYLTPFWGHLKHLLLAFLVMVITHQFAYRNIRFWVLLIPICSLILLMISPMLGKDVNGAIRSINIGGFELQTIELSKLAVIIIMAEMLGYFHSHKRNMGLKPFCILAGVLCLFCVFVVIQNFSTAFILFGVSILMMLIANVPYKYIFSLIGIVVITCGLFIGVSYALGIKNGITKRVDTWIVRAQMHMEAKEDNNSTKTIIIDDANRQIINSKIAIANGISPCGPGNSVQRDYLALAFSDFVYAVIIEEYGIVGGIIIILMYIIILGRAGKIARQCTKDQATESLLVIGLALIIVLQAFINMAVATELGPVTGQTLPFISRGGMSLLITAACFGLILGISAQNEERINKEQTMLEETPAETNPTSALWVPQNAY